MQSDNIQEGARDLCRKLIDLDPIQANSAINQYFDAAALLESREVTVKGAERIKKQFRLVNHAFKESDLVGEPSWSEAEQTINFTYSRLIQTPKLVWPLCDLPLINRLSKAKATIHYDGSLHLNPDGDMAAGRAPNLMVTKYVVNRREQAPLENLIPYYLLKPFLSTVSNVIATVATIVLSNPMTPKGLIFMISSLINNFWLWFYDKVADLSEGAFPQKANWANGPGSDLPGQESSLLSSAEDQAKKLGLPVDRARQFAVDIQGQASAAINALKSRVEEDAPQLKEKAQVIAEETKQDAKEVAEKVEEKGKETKGNVEEAAEGNIGTESAKEDENKAAADRSDIPGTPFGGTDPLAKGAPSYAGAAAEESNRGFNNEAVPQAGDSGSALQDSSDFPSTPFGGTDPLADGAPSYANAAKE